MVSLANPAHNAEQDSGTCNCEERGGGREKEREEGKGKRGGRGREGEWKRDSRWVGVLHGKYVYSTLALEKEREIVKEVTALRKENQYAVMLYKDAYNRIIIYTGSRDSLENHMHTYIYIQAAATA